MPNQKGSLKDRIRSWLLFLNYKMKLKRQQQEENKKIKQKKKEVQILASGKYYSKPKVFCLTIFGLFLGLFEGKKKKSVKTLEQSVKTLEQSVSILEKKVENNTIDQNDIVEIKSIEEELIRDKSQISYNYKQKINNIKTKLNKQQFKFIVDENQNEEKLENKKNIDSFSKTGVYIPKLEIKVFNKDLKKYNKYLKDMNDKIKDSVDYNQLYEYEFLAKQLKIRLNELLNKYENLKKIPGFKLVDDMIIIKDIDEFDLRKNNKKIKESISWCETTLIVIENKKKELLTKSEEQKEEKVEEKKEIKKTDKPKKKIEEKKDDKLLELILADKIIYDSIVKERRKITKFNRMITTMNKVQKRHSIFYYSKNLISSIVNFSLSLFPLSLFKNKMLGGLVSGIMLNNSLRSVRKVLNPDIEISYIYNNVENEIISTSNYLNRLASICDDSLRQIENIRNTIYINYGNDINYNSSLSGYLDDLRKIETKIEYEQTAILGMNEDLKIVREKNKQKIKKIDGYYN